MAAMAALAPAASPAPRPSRPGTLLVALLAIALGAQLAYWTWALLAPASPPAMAAPEAVADLGVAAKLFGSSASSASTPSGTAPSGLRLKGVVAPTPGRTASAIFGTGAGRDVAVKIDGDVQPGVKLVQVLPDAAVVSRGGVRERIELERLASAAPSGASGRGGAPSAFRLNVARSGTNNYSLSRKELDEALRDPNQLNYLGRIGVAPGGGVRMDAAPPGSLAAKLGLQPGDIITRVNGQAVASPGDLARLYTQFNTLSMVQAEVKRGGLPVQVSYAIQP